MFILTEPIKLAQCPRCGQDTLRADKPALNALSRTDNRTYVCSDCGMREGLEAFSQGEPQHSKEAWVAPEAATLMRGE